MSSPFRHYPGPVASLFVALAATLATVAVVLLLLDPEADGAGIGIGVLGISQAVGLGVIGTLAARRVPPPQAERLGLVRLPPAYWGIVAALVPLSLVASELVNLAHAAMPAPDAREIFERASERLDTASPLGAIETAIVTVGLAPVVEEWLYRGVIQQGTVATLGRLRGVALASLLFTLGHSQPTFSAGSLLAIFLGTFPVGVVLGLLRLASGSLLAPILLHAAYNGVGVLALAQAGSFPIPGYNTPGEHIALLWLAPSVALVALALRPVWRDALAAPQALPLPTTSDEDD